MGWQLFSFFAFWIILFIKHLCYRGTLKDMWSARFILFLTSELLLFNYSWESDKCMQFLAVDLLWQKKPFFTSDSIVFIALVPDFDIKVVYITCKL